MKQRLFVFGQFQDIQSLSTITEKGCEDFMSDRILGDYASGPEVQKLKIREK